MKLSISENTFTEKNGYPDNNFTEKEYMAYIKDIKKELQSAVNDLENIAKKQLEINERGDYNSILTAEDKDQLFKRCAILHSASNFLDMCNLIKNR